MEPNKEEPLGALVEAAAVGALGVSLTVVVALSCGLLRAGKRLFEGVAVEAPVVGAVVVAWPIVNPPAAAVGDFEELDEAGAEGFAKLKVGCEGVLAKSEGAFDVCGAESDPVALATMF